MKTEQSAFLSLSYQHPKDKFSEVFSAGSASLSPKKSIKGQDPHPAKVARKLHAEGAKIMSKK